MDEQVVIAIAAAAVTYGAVTAYLMFDEWICDGKRTLRFSRRWFVIASGAVAVVGATVSRAAFWPPERGATGPPLAAGLVIVVALIVLLLLASAGRASVVVSYQRLRAPAAPREEQVLDLTRTEVKRMAEELRSAEKSRVLTHRRLARYDQVAFLFSALAYSLAALYSTAAVS